MKRQLRVIKADGTGEAYLHTKVIGAVNNALSATGQADMALAEELAEVVTFYLYNQDGKRKVTSNEIFSMIKAVLASTGHEEAAAALSEHAYERRLKRARTEVLAIDVQDYPDMERLFQANPLPPRTRWDKARIVHDLTAKSGSPRSAPSGSSRWYNLSRPDSGRPLRQSAFARDPVCSYRVHPARYRSSAPRETS